jgi:Secretion system C-terminal sorting domain
LLGHVPVPYSGQLYPDGHQDHEGAWPADMYYGEMNGFWTDASVNFIGAADSRNHNVPGDGKFDQSVIPSNIDLQVSRIDFANLPAFTETESELLKKYLDKNHAFRHKHFTATPRGLLENNFGGAAEGFGLNAYRNFTTMFGIDGTDVVDYNTLKTESYLWSYGAGGGTYTSANGIITTEELATDSIQSVFSMLFGSYFGDWDSQNNLLRAALGSGTVLTNAWAGRPKFQFEHMALGENIGYGLPLTQNTATNFIQDTCYGGRLTHIALMGDLTLRMHIVTPPGENLIFSENDGDLTVSWMASPDADLGYHVFRKEIGAAFFERLTDEPVTQLNYTIECVDPDIEYVYMVRALRLENSASGSYYNLSQGVKGNYTLQVGCISALSNIENVSVVISPIPTDDLLHVKLSAPTAAVYQLELRNVNGQAVLQENMRAQQTHTLSTAHLPAGMYLLVIWNESGELVSRKVSVFRD